MIVVYAAFYACKFCLYHHIFRNLIDFIILKLSFRRLHANSSPEQKKNVKSHRDKPLLLQFTVVAKFCHDCLFYYFRKREYDAKLDCDDDYEEVRRFTEHNTYKPLKTVRSEVDIL